MNDHNLQLSVYIKPENAVEMLQNAKEHLLEYVLQQIPFATTNEISISLEPSRLVWKATLTWHWGKGSS